MWSLFSSEPLVPYLFPNVSMREFGLPEFSGFWITIPLGIGMFYLLYKKLDSVDTGAYAVASNDKISDKGLVAGRSQKNLEETLEDLGVEILGSNLGVSIFVTLKNTRHVQPLTRVAVHINGLMIWSPFNRVFCAEQKFYKSKSFPLKIEGPEMLFLDETAGYKFITLTKDGKLQMEAHNHSRKIVFDGEGRVWRAELQVDVEDKKFTTYFCFSRLPSENPKFIECPSNEKLPI